MAMDNTSYSQWLSQNPSVMQQPVATAAMQQQPATTSYSSYLSQPQAGATPATTATAPQATEAQGMSGYERAKPIVEAITGGQRQLDTPFKTRESAYNTSPATQSDAPSVTPIAAAPAKKDKIAQIVASIFTWGASQAMADGAKAQGGNGAASVQGR